MKLKKMIVPKTFNVGNLKIKENTTLFVEVDEKELPLIEITDEIRVKILDFLRNTEIKDDKKDVHKFAEDMKMNTHQLELEIYIIVQCFFRGGKAFDKGVTEKDVNQDELKVGRDEIEIEHVDVKNPYAKFITTRIALDHFAEITPPKNSKYYAFLKNMEKEVEKDAEGK